ncbi:hypothetical protein AFCDBAGC_2355 [Methylobacterium cerastii]|uniref:Anti-sigma factor NepR domain-containing protein n=1 Tax=Methylobacterium cerastii TaxID=932741 RepID=A0ABQ4QH17_9HYPH|nr:MULTISPECIES: NepR family anti-sigma factor [Methylobacterium]GJD44488.1 hypothetical protein AFCDBAGC_2355 [Methylobacterium cerastii]
MQDIPDERGADRTIVRPPEVVVVRASERRPRGDGRLDAETRRRIGRSLRVLYAGLLAQPIPERFEALVAELAARSEKESAR